MYVDRLYVIHRHYTNLDSLKMIFKSRLHCNSSLWLIQHFLGIMSVQNAAKLNCNLRIDPEYDPC